MMMMVESALKFYWNGWDTEMKHVMYTTPTMNFVHTYGKSYLKDAEVRVWSDELRCYVGRTGRDFAAMALRKLRKNGVKLERKVVTR